MAQHFSVHPDNPQIRLLKQATALLDRGGIVAVPPIQATRWPATSTTRRRPTSCGASAAWTRNTT
jgi:hypothetical protein